jgi:hypothetical protein
MKFAKLALLVLFIPSCMLISTQVQAKGTLVKIEHFTPDDFCPKNGETSCLTYYVLDNSILTVRIFNFAGKRVLEKRIGFLYKGKHAFVWDGRNSKERIVPAGFYKCELQASGYGQKVSDNDYAITLVSDTPAIPVKLKLPAKFDWKKLPVEISGFVRSITEADSKGIFNWDKKEIQFDLKGRHSDNWKYDLRFFPFQDPGQPFNWSDFLELRMGYYEENWEIEAGYHNYIEGYGDPLNLFEDYKMATDRISVFAGSGFTGNLNLHGGFHRIPSRDEYAVEGHSTYKIAEGMALNGCTVNKIAPEYSDNVLSVWGDFTKIKGIAITTEIAASITCTNSIPVRSSGTAARMDIKYSFPDVPADYGSFLLSCGIESVGKYFVCDYADLPNGIDDYGAEVIGEYNKNFGLLWLGDLKLEIKKAYFRNTDNTLQTQKFRPTASVKLADGLDCYLHYDYTGVEDISTGKDNPVSRLRTALGEIHYYRPGGKLDTYFSYTTSKNAAATFSDYTSTRTVFGYHFTPQFHSYIGCEKIVNIALDKWEADCYFWTLGCDWTIIPKYKTKFGIQTGFVRDNMSPPNDRWTYYGEFSQYFFDRFSILIAYGSLTSIDPSPNFSAQFKFEF